MQKQPLSDRNMAPLAAGGSVTVHPLVVRFSDWIPEGKVLDLGMGAGENLSYLARSGRECEGIDIDAKSVDRVNRYARENLLAISCASTDLRAIELPTRSYAAILLLNVLHEFEIADIERLTSEVQRALIRDGLVLVHALSVEDTHSKSERNQDRFRHWFECNEIPRLFSHLTVLYSVYQLVDARCIPDQSRLSPGELRGTVMYVGQRGA